MRILDRYILREIALHSLAVTGILAVIFLFVRIAKVLELAANYQFPRDVVFGLIGWYSITDLPMLIPIGLFMGVMLALGRLYHDSEMAALQSSGMGIRDLFRPVFGVAFLATAVLTWLTLVFVPDVFGRAYQIRMDAIRASRLTAIAPQHFGSFAGGGVVYYAESVDASGVLYNVFVQWRVGDKVQVAVADRAEQHGAGETQQSFVLYQGEMYTGVPGSGLFRIARFKEFDLPVPIHIGGGSATRIESRASTDLIASGNAVDRAEFEIRLSSPIMGLILTVLAVPLARLRPRQGRYSKMWLALLAYFIYQLAVVAAKSWIEKETLPKDLGLWWVHVLAAGCAAWLVLRQDPLRLQKPKQVAASP
jgi:lipopolysaccharide export system permease protein